MNKSSCFKLSVMAGSLFSVATLSAAPITTPQTITGVQAWGSDSPITITGQKNNILVDGGNLTMTDIDANITGTLNGGYAFSAVNNGTITMNGGFLHHEAVSNGSNSFTVRSGGKVNVNNAELLITGYDSSNIFDLRDNGSNVSVTNSKLISENGNLIHAQGTATNPDVTVDLKDTEIYLADANTVDKEIYSYSIAAQGGAKIIGEGLTIVSDLSGSPSLVASGLLGNGFIFNASSNNSTIELKNSSVTSNKGQGLMMSTNGIISGDGLTLDFTSNDSDTGSNVGMQFSNSTINLTNTTYKASGDAAIFAAYLGGTTNMTGKNLTVDATDNIQAVRLQGNNNSVILTDSHILTTKGAFAGNVAAIILSGASAGSENKLNLTKTVIDAEGWALEVRNGYGIIDASEVGTIIKGKDGGAIISAALTSNTELTTNIKNGAALQGEVSARNDAGLNSKLNLNLKNTSLWQGDGTTTDKTSNLNISLSDSSTWKGAAYNLNNGLPAGIINVDINASQWDLTKDSTVNNLLLTEAIVNVGDSSSDPYRTLTVSNLSGKGTFSLRADVVGQQGDLLKVADTTAGAHLLKIKSNGSDATTGQEVLTVVETADGADVFSLAAPVDLGGYRYGLRKNTTNWELYASGQLSANANKTVSFLNTSYLLNYAETQTLLQRMGELRQSENANGDVWVRAFTGKFDSFGGGKLSGFDMDYTGVQAGVDKRLDINGSDVYLGMMGGTSKADTNYKEGDGNVTGYHFGLYGTYVAENDFYVDTVLKYSNFKNSFNVDSDEYGRIDSNVGSDGYGLSVEAGKRFYFDPSKSGYYIEPQAQLSYAHQGSASTTVDGLRVNMDSYDSTLGRVSAQIGYDVKNSQNPMNVYFKTGYVTEMSGKTGYSLNGNKESHDFGGDWWENSIGLTAQINKAHNLYVEGTYSTGSKFDQMQINAGYRYSF